MRSAHGQRPGSAAERAIIARIERRLIATYRPAARRARTAAQRDRIRVRLRLRLIEAFAQAGVR